MEKVLRKSLFCLGLLALVATSTKGQPNHVQGTLYYIDQGPFSDVTVIMHRANGTLYGTKTTGNNGSYSFKNVPSGTYHLSFETQMTAGGVSLSDAYLIGQYLMGSYQFVSIQDKLADVDADNAVTWDDYYYIIDEYLNQGIPFPAGPWYFQDTTITHPSSSRDGGIVTSGGSVGDINGTFQPPKYGNSFINIVEAPDVICQPSQTVKLQLTSDSDFEFIGFHLVFDVPEDLELLSMHTDIEGVRFFKTKSGDQVRVTYLNRFGAMSTIPAQAPIIEFEMQVRGSEIPDAALRLNLNQQSHVIGQDGEMLPYTKFSLPGVLSRGPQDISITEILYPNPFLSHFTLEYELPFEGSVQITITNAAGQVVESPVHEHQTAGLHQFVIDGAAWAEGMYYYTIRLTGEDKIFKSGSMIKSK